MWIFNWIDMNIKLAAFSVSFAIQKVWEKN